MEQREIKFRAKRKSDGQWVYGDLITKPIHHECVILESGCINHSVIAETVGQYTGIKDKYEREVFEGDLIRKECDVLPVEYYDSCFRTPKNGSSYRLGGWRKQYIEVIGNIHEHHHLLTQPA